MSPPLDLRPHRPAIGPEQIDDLRHRLFGGDPTPPAIPGYEVETLLGRGAFGRVYRAFDPRFGRTVALKVVEVDSVGARLRIEREAQSLARLSHPHVVQVYDKGPVGDRAYFLALEYIDGPDLEQWLKQARHSPREILAKFLDVARGLAAAHQAGLVHRDFKAANAMVGPDGRVRVLDFGLARAQEDLPSLEDHSDPRTTVAANDSGPAPGLARTLDWSEPSAEGSGPSDADDPRSAASPHPWSTPLTRAGRFVGTPCYAAPEQHEGRADARSDQFSFFVVLYQALYRRRPFGTPRGDDSWRAVLERPIDFGRAPHRLPRWVIGLLRRGLALDPADRHPSMEAVAEQIQRGLRRRTPRRTAALLGGAAALGATLAGALGLWSGDAIERCRAERARWPEAWVEHGATVRSQHPALAASIDDYADRWQAGRQAACHVAEPTARATADACLDQGAEHLAELAGWLTTADRHTWAALRAHPGPWPLAELLAALPAPSACAAGTRAPTPEPHQVWPSLLAGRIALEQDTRPEATEQADRALALARSLGERALVVAAEALRLQIAARYGEPRDLTAILSLVGRALEAHQHPLAAELAASSMALASAGMLPPDPEAEPPMSPEAVTRLADELAALRASERGPALAPVVTGWLRYTEGHALLALHDYAGARARYHEATTLLTGAEPPLAPHLVAAVELYEAIAMGASDPTARAARSLAVRALQTRRAALGPDHPTIALETLRVGRLHAYLDDLDGALALYEHAERSFEARGLWLDRAFARSERVHAHWLGARRARAAALRAEREGDDPAPHWDRFERQRHLALHHTLALEQQLPPTLAPAAEGPPPRPHEQARLWAVAMRSYLYHRGCWDQALAAGRNLEQVCTGLDASDPACADGLNILRSIVERGLESTRTDDGCRADPGSLPASEQR